MYSRNEIRKYLESLEPHKTNKIKRISFDRFNDLTLDSIAEQLHKECVRKDRFDLEKAEYLINKWIDESEQQFELVGIKTAL